MVNVQVLASTSASGPFTSALSPVTPGTTIYYEKSLSSLPPVGQPMPTLAFTPTGRQMPSIRCPISQLMPAVRRSAPQRLGSQFIGVGHSTGTASGSTLSNVRVIAANGTRVADDSPIVVLSGSLTAGAGFSSITAASNPFPPTNTGVLYVGGHIVTASSCPMAAGPTRAISRSFPMLR